MASRTNTLAGSTSATDARWGVLRQEIGARAAHELALENSFTEKRRLRAIGERLLKAIFPWGW